jgi:hypothetical protein
MVKNGRIYLKNKQTIILGVSPGNPFFYKMENLEKMFRFSKDNSNHKVRRVHSKYNGYICIRDSYSNVCPGSEYLYLDDPFSISSPRHDH